MQQQEEIISDAEYVLRALHEPFWHPDTKQPSPSAFKGNDISVSRIAVLSFEKIVKIFETDLNKPATENSNSRTVQAVAKISVCEIKAGCGEIPNSGVIVEVIGDPVPNSKERSGNPAHALIKGWSSANPKFPKEITRGMANKILRRCEIIEI